MIDKKGGLAWGLAILWLVVGSGLGLRGMWHGSEMLAVDQAQGLFLAEAGNALSTPATLLHLLTMWSLGGSVVGWLWAVPLFLAGLLLIIAWWHLLTTLPQAVRQIGLVFGAALWAVGMFPLLGLTGMPGGPGPDVAFMVAGWAGVLAACQRKTSWVFLVGSGMGLLLATWAGGWLGAVGGAMILALTWRLIGWAGTAVALLMGVMAWHGQIGISWTHYLAERGSWGMLPQAVLGILAVVSLMVAWPLWRAAWPLGAHGVRRLAPIYALSIILTWVVPALWWLTTLLLILALAPAACWAWRRLRPRAGVGALLLSVGPMLILVWACVASVEPLWRWLALGWGAVLGLGLAYGRIRCPTWTVGGALTALLLTGLVIPQIWRDPGLSGQYLLREIRQFHPPGTNLAVIGPPSHVDLLRGLLQQREAKDLQRNIGTARQEVQRQESLAWAQSWLLADQQSRTLVLPTAWVSDDWGLACDWVQLTDAHWGQWSLLIQRKK